VRLCINGDRFCNKYEFLEKAIAHYNINPEYVVEVVSGKAKGGDKLGEDWAKEHNIPITPFPAAWKDLDAPGAIIKEGEYGQYNAKAGFDRNQKMADYSDCLLCLQPNGDTSGSQDCVDRFLAQNKEVMIYPPPKKVKKYDF
jgi:hypothetical protein